jgi:hypothetical protein
MTFKLSRSLLLLSSSLLLNSGCTNSNFPPNSKEVKTSQHETVSTETNAQASHLINTPLIAWNRYNFNYLARTGESSEKKPSETVNRNEWGALAFFTELAPRNFRGSATYGNYFAQKHRFKITGEYLVQKLGFDFESGDQKKWVSQLVFGGEYQYLIHHSVFQSFELGSAYVHAFNRHLNTRSTPHGTIERRIAGSNGSLSYMGTTVKLWNCAFLSAALNYDWVHFNRHYKEDKLSNGFGGSAGFVQRFARDFALNLDAEFRHPFNSYRGLLIWNHDFSSCNLDLGIFGNLTHGHDGVRRIATVGLQLGISFGTKSKACSWSTEMPSHRKDCHNKEFCDLSQWVSTPAVYVPIVLAIADEKLPNCDGKAPTSKNPGNQFVPLGTLTLLPSYISSSLPVTYTISQSEAPLPGNTLSFDSVTGILTASASGANSQIITVTITATNSCGSTSVTFDVLYPGIA